MRCKKIVQVKCNWEKAWVNPRLFPMKTNVYRPLIKNNNTYIDYGMASFKYYFEKPPPINNLNESHPPSTLIHLRVVKS